MKPNTNYLCVNFGELVCIAVIQRFSIYIIQLQVTVKRATSQQPATKFQKFHRI